MSRFLAVAALWWAGLSLVAAAADEARPLLARRGYSIDKVAGEPDVQFPMFAAFDERGRLFVAESSGLDLYAELRKLSRTCRISMLEDLDGDGRFERSRVFADQLVFPMGLAWRDGRLYVADPPYVITIEDQDGDGRGDKRSRILEEFGHLDNGSLHGLVFGPDGWLYMTMGQPDGYRITRADGSVLSGNSGALIRCRPDGSDPEVVCRGFENLVEIDFHSTGEIVGTDNWFSFPAAGVRDALVHLVEGGLYPTILQDSGTAMLASGPPLPCISAYPAVAFSGMTRYRGTAFPAASRGDWFSAQHNTRQVMQHHFDRDGASFRCADSPLVTTQNPDFHPSDVLEDADGSLLIIDTGSWYIHHCPTGRIRNAPARGGIYRVRCSQAPVSPDPRGLRLDWNDPSVDELNTRVVDGRIAVRGRAVEHLAAKGAPAIRGLAERLRGEPEGGALEAVIWALARIPGGAQPLVEALAHRNPDHAALAARALGRVGAPQAATALEALLKRPEAHVRLAAAEALARCGGPENVPGVIDALSRSDDRFIEHSLIYVLYLFATTHALTDALRHPAPQVQRAALVLLDQPPRNALAPEDAVARLFAANVQVREAARAALAKHSNWIEHALPALQRVAADPDPQEPDLAMLRECLLAFHAHPQLAALGSEILAANGSASVAARGAVLEAITLIPARQSPKTWEKQLAALVLAPGSPLKAKAIAAARASQSPELDGPLAAVAADEGLDADLRVTALGAVVRRLPSLQPSHARLLLEQLEPRHSPAARLAAAELLSQARLSGKDLSAVIAKARSDPVLSPSFVIAAAQRCPDARDLWSEIVGYIEDALETGWPLAPEALQWIQGLLPPSADSSANKLQRLGAQREARQHAQLSEFEPLLTGGDPNRGHELFLTKAACVGCHRIGKHGGVTGPDLTKVGAIRSGRDLLESLVAPSATFAQGYEPYTVTLKDGETLSGVRVRRPGDVFVLREASGAEVALSADQLDSVRQSQVSLMPEGLLSVLTTEEIRDLLAYLQSLR